MAKRILHVATSIILVVSGFSSHCQAQIRSTSHTYFYQENVALELDLYKSSSQAAPLMLFVHGGGFVGGSKKASTYLPFFQTMNDKGIDVVSIDYSMPLLGQKFHCDQSAENKIMAFGHAARDIRRSTQWLIQNGDSLQINSDNIWLCGSSAGAEALLFALFGTDLPQGSPLPDSFSYAGFVSIAGACTDLNLITKENAIPGMFIHGSCDPLVPLGTAMHHYCPENYPGALLLHGPESITARYDELEKPYLYLLYCGVNHSLANHSLELDIDRIAIFILDDGKAENMRIVIGRNDTCQFPGSASCGDD